MSSLEYKKIFKVICSLIYAITLFLILFHWFFSIWVYTPDEYFKYGKMTPIYIMMYVGFYVIIDKSLDGYKAGAYYVKNIIDKEYESQKLVIEENKKFKGDK